MPTRFWTAMAGLLGLCGVALGAVAAHAVADAHAAQMLSQAAAYQIMHAVALLALSLMPGTLPARGAGAAKGAFLLGILGFSGGLALKYLGGPDVGAVIPAGGILLMLGWAIVLAASFTRPKKAA